MGESGHGKSSLSSVASLSLPLPHIWFVELLTPLLPSCYLFITCHLGSEIQRIEISGLSPLVVLQGWPGAAWQHLQPHLNWIGCLLIRHLTVVFPYPALSHLSQRRMLAGRVLRIIWGWCLFESSVNLDLYIPKPKLPSSFGWGEGWNRPYFNSHFSFPQLNKPVNQNTGRLPLLSVSERLRCNVQMTMVMKSQSQRIKQRRWSGNKQGPRGCWWDGTGGISSLPWFSDVQRMLFQTPKSWELLQL